jgi:hypothetical protein
MYVIEIKLAMASADSLRMIVFGRINPWYMARDAAGASRLFRKIREYGIISGTVFLVSRVRQICYAHTVFSSGTL